MKMGRRDASYRTRAIMELASRPCGTNMLEAGRFLGIHKHQASDRLNMLASRGAWLVKVPGKRGNGQIIYTQYFVHREHAVAWQASETRANQAVMVTAKKRAPKAPRPLAKKERTANPKSRIQIGTWSKLGYGRITAKVAPPPQTQGLAAGWDGRYQCSPEESDALRTTGYFSSGAYRLERR